jgi:glycosyltransferase involved in cell wall biosynthesis
MNNKVYLIFAGEGDDRNELELHAKKYGLSDIVNISGHMRYYDMPAFYSALNWYIQPSKYESFGQAACEAQACGIPTVVSDIGGLPEVVPAGFPNLVTEHTVEAWAEALRQMLEVDTSTRARWREAARQHVVDNFAPEKIAQQWIDLFHQVLGK